MSATQNFLLIVIVVFQFLVAHTQNGDGDGFLVTTNSGKVLGSTANDLNGNVYYSFRAIPYARKPVGELRFKKPQPVDPWNHILDATKPAPVCPQKVMHVENRMVGQEDCLYLNIFTPSLPNVTANSSLLPVMVYIHGGAFYVGSSVEMLGPDFLLPENVLVATFNYRIGFLGFLNFENSTTKVPGNAGMKDQVMALKWINDNIKYFGGDPNNITIFGISAGGASVHLHVLSPMSKGLFHKAILQSGCALNLWVGGMKDTGKILGKALNITAENDGQLLDALRKVSIRRLIEAQNNLLNNFGASQKWASGIVVERKTYYQPAFLPDEPINLIKSGNFNDVPLIIGYASQEGMTLQVDWKLDHGIFLNVTDFKPYIPYDLKNNPAHLDEIATKIKHFYTSRNDPSTLQPTMNFISDTWFIYHIYQTAIEHAKVSNHSVYVYRFSADTKLNIFKRRVPELSIYSGACHTDDLGYLFMTNETETIKKGSIEDECMERSVMLWTNFAKFGNPTPKNDNIFNNTIWTPFAPSQNEIVEIGNDISKHVNPDVDRFQFWADLYRDYSYDTINQNENKVY